MNESTLSPAHAEAVLEAFNRSIGTMSVDRNKPGADGLSERAYQLAALARGHNVRPGEDVRLETLRIDAFQRYMAHATRTAALRFDSAYLKLTEACESPIEKLLVAALLPEMLMSGFWEIVPQHKIGRYRADFLIRATHDDYQSVIVECDGHDFHDRTKDQVARDKKRDRTIQAAGYPVLRFTGSELHNDAQACANEVLAFVYKQAEAG